MCLSIAAALSTIGLKSAAYLLTGSVDCGRRPGIGR